MIDHIFCAVLTFCLLAGGTIAIGSALNDHELAAQRQAQAITLPAVTVIGKRESAALARAESLDPAARQLR